MVERTLAPAAAALQISDGDALPEGAQILTPTRFDLSGFQVLEVGNETIVIGTQIKAGLILGAEGAAIQSVPVIQISMSHQTLKDLSVVLSERVANYEKNWGVIETPFTRKSQEEKSK
jgi:hypothetical protein